MDQKRVLEEAVVGNMDAVRKYVKKGGDPNIRDWEGATLLHRAVYHGDLETAELLLKRGADPNARDREGNTPLHWAAKICSSSRNMVEKLDRLVALLASYGADINAKNDWGETPLHVAAYEECADKATSIFLKYGADPNIKGIDGETLLDIAVFGSRYEAIKALAEAGGGLNKATPFDCLRSKYSDLCVEPLLKYGLVAVDTKDSEGRTLLHYAAMYGHVALAKLLLKHGADPEARDAYGRTPLCYATERERSDVVQTLLEHGADSRRCGEGVAELRN